MGRVQIPGTEDDLRVAVRDANLPTLLLVLAQLTGDDEWLSERYAPAPIATPEGSLFPDDTGGYDDDLADEIRARAFETLCRLRDEGAEVPQAPSLERLRQMMQFSVAEPVDEAFAAMLLEETGFVDRDTHWQDSLSSAKAAGSSDFTVLVVGAGMSGICAGAKLKQAGIEFTIIEKNDAVGGTWYENRYPDCGVDTPNHFYSYSFERNANWSGYFSKRDELYEYFEHCADAFGLRPYIRLNTEVTSMRYQEATATWEVEILDAQGNGSTLIANAVISAVGQLNRPNIPDFEGLESFRGESFHSARWRHDVALEGRRVAVIGTGCSAVQLVPKTAERAAHLTVFQRSPHWVSPNRDYYRPVEEGLIWALNNIPQYAEWHRARMIFGFMDRNWPAVPADPDWPHPERSMSEANEGLRQALTAYIGVQVGGRPDLIEKCVPDFPVFGKRLIIDNNWYPTLAREDVDLVTDPISAITPEGIQTADGTVHEVDVIIYATGFKTNKFLWPMDVVGKSGTTLGEQWGDAPKAFKGILVPDYPNLFCLYGPNTNIVHGGSIIYCVEAQMHYVMQCLATMAERKAVSVEVPDAVNDAYNEEVQAVSRTLAWGHSGVQSWYKNAAGQVVNNSPFSNLEYWQRTHDFEPDEMVLK